MKLNLKKAISAVIALALSASLVPASFAAKLVLSDVADTASYATAVNTLVALDVINGYEDGTFLPDNLITRAEATKVMVAALNQLNAAEGMKGSTQFADVEARHEWATGYINAGVQNGYINGMGDGTFAPDANVTYAQMVKMLVSAMGYDDYATYMGGYPDGYLAIAATEGLTKGVAANKNQNVTRAQVAQLVYNALLAPVVQETGIEWTDNGQLRPKIQKMDGKDVAYKSLLTEKFNAFYAEGYVDAADKEEVTFYIAKSENYDDEGTSFDEALKSYAEAKEDGKQLIAFIGGTDAADYKGTYAAAIFAKNEYDEYTVVSFQPSGKNKSVVFDASLIADDNNIAENNYLNIFANKSATKATKYNLQLDDGVLNVNIYVNGIKIDSATDAAGMRAAIETYVLGATAGEIELVDTYRTDGYYDAIYVKKYATTMVDSVVSTSNKIVFKDTCEGEISLVLDEEANEDLDYKIFYNGEEISMLELQENDVLSIAYDVNGAFDVSDYYEIYVSRNIQTGSVAGISGDETEVTVGGEVYTFVSGDASDNDVEIRNEYMLYVDAFGRIYKAELNTSAVKYALITKYYDKANSDYDNDRVRLFTAEGETKTLELGTGVSVTGLSDINVAGYSDDVAALEAYEKVVEYSVSSKTGKINSIALVDYSKVSDGVKAYNASTGKIDGIGIGDATKVVDVVKYSETDAHEDLALGSKASFADDGIYVVYAYGKNSDNTYQLVLVWSGDAVYNEDTHFAVVSGDISTGVVDDEEVKYIPVADVDADKTLVGITGEYAVKKAGEDASLTIGDVIVYQTDAAGYVERVDILFNAKKDSYNALVNAAMVNDYTGLISLPAELTANDFSDEWVEGYDDAKDINLVLGAVISKSNNGMSIAKVDASKYTNVDEELIDIDLTSDTVVYEYDYTKSSSNVEKGAIGTIVKSSFTGLSYLPESDLVERNTILNWNSTDAKEGVNLVFAKVVDGTATDVLVITGEY